MTHLRHLRGLGAGGVFCPAGRCRLGAEECWAPATLEVMSSSNADALAVCACGVYRTPWLLPGVTALGETSVGDERPRDSSADRAAADGRHAERVSVGRHVHSRVAGGDACE